MTLACGKLRFRASYHHKQRARCGFGQAPEDRRFAVGAAMLFDPALDVQTFARSDGAHLHDHFAMERCRTGRSQQHVADCVGIGEQQEDAVGLAHGQFSSAYDRNPLALERQRLAGRSVEHYHGVSDRMDGAGGGAVDTAAAR